MPSFAERRAKKSGHERQKGAQPPVSGDYVKILSVSGNWVEIWARGRNDWVGKERLQENRILEINFVDVGQGDGCRLLHVNFFSRVKHIAHPDVSNVMQICAWP